MKVYVLEEQDDYGDNKILGIYSRIQTALEHTNTLDREWIDNVPLSKEDKCIKYTEDEKGKKDYYINEYEVY